MAETVITRQVQILEQRFFAYDDATYKLVVFVQGVKIRWVAFLTTMFIQLF